MNNKILKKGLSIFTLFLAILPIILMIFCFVFVDPVENPEILQVGKLSIVNGQLTGSGISGMIIDYLDIGNNGLIMPVVEFLVNNAFFPCSLVSIYAIYIIYLYLFITMIEMAANIVFIAPNIINKWLGRWID